MSDAFFRLPLTETDTGGMEPQYLSNIEGIAGFAGTRAGNSPQLFARVVGTEAALEDLANKQGVTRFSTGAAQALVDNSPHIAASDATAAFRVGASEP